MATYTSYSLSTSLPLPTSKQPRSAVAYDETNIVIGFVDGNIASFDVAQDTPLPTYTLREESTHKIANGMILGLNIVPEGHELLAETSIVACSADKSLQNVLSDGTPIFTISPLTDPLDAHSASVENSSFASDAKMTLMSAGWDGKVKFWNNNECMLSLQQRNEYSTQILSLAGNKLIMASASKVLSWVSINYDKLYTEFATKQQNIANTLAANNNSMNDFASLGDFHTAQDILPGTAMLTENEAITAEIVTIVGHRTNAHDQAIRRIIPLYSSAEAMKAKDTDQIATIGNDGLLKVWKLNSATSQFDLLGGIEIIRSVGDQSEFLYDVVQIPQYLADFNYADNMSLADASSKLIVAIACDDSTVRFIDISSFLDAKSIDSDSMPKNEKLVTSPKIQNSYHSPFEIQCIEFPAVPRFLSMLPTSDFITITPAGAFILSMNDKRYGNDELHQAFNQSISSAAEKAKKMTNINIESLASVETLFSPAEKNGQHKIVNIDGKPMVVQWSEERFEWVLIGEAMGADNSESQGSKKFYQGQYYDHTVDVDIGGPNRLILAFNSNDDPYVIAQKFLETHQLGQEALLQIVQFIMPYIDQKKLKQRKEQEEFAAQNQLSYISTNSWPYTTRTTLNINLIMKAVNARVATFLENNQQADMLWSSANIDPLADQPLQHLYNTIHNAPCLDPTVFISKGDIAILLTMFTKWSATQLTPIFDILRVIAASPVAHGLLLNPSEASPSVSQSMIYYSTSTANINTLFDESQTGPFQQQFYEVLHVKSMEISSQSLVINNKQSFATLSLMFDLFSNIIGKRPYIRSEKAFNDMLSYLEYLHSTFSTMKHPTTKLDFAQYISHSGNPFGPQLIPKLIALVSNIASFANRIPKAQFGAMYPRIGALLCNWIQFLLNIFQKTIDTNVDNTVIDSTTSTINNDKISPLLIDFATMICFESNAFEEVKLVCQDYTQLFSIVSKSLTVLMKDQQSTAQVSNNARDLIHDLKILFAV